MKKLIVFIFLFINVYSCNLKFEGFGVFIGSLDSFAKITSSLRNQAIDYLYNDLKIRNFRTEYLAEFSPRENEYSFICSSPKLCTWLDIHSQIFKLDQIKVFSSIWSPPHYMKNSNTFMLNTSYEEKYYFYILNITNLIKKKFNFTIEKVSIANEPENIFSSWDHVIISAEELCKIIDKNNNSLIKLCSENSYFWITNIYTEYKSSTVDCTKSCKIVISHGYKPNLQPFSLNFGKVYYDLKVYERTHNKPIWITEISSTYYLAEFTQIREAIDLANSIINFVGKTCVQRFYYWLAFTIHSSGESLIWYKDNKLVLPKKYFAFRHFTRSAYNVSYSYDCSTDNYLCIQFDNKPVFVNKQYNSVPINYTCNLCCTTKLNDYSCSHFDLPSQSICSCQD